MSETTPEINLTLRITERDLLDKGLTACVAEAHNQLQLHLDDVFKSPNPSADHKAVARLRSAVDIWNYRNPQ